MSLIFSSSENEFAMVFCLYLHIISSSKNLILKTFENIDNVLQGLGWQMNEMRAIVNHRHQRNQEEALLTQC